MFFVRIFYTRITADQMKLLLKSTSFLISSSRVSTDLCLLLSLCICRCRTNRSGRTICKSSQTYDLMIVVIPSLRDRWQPYIHLSLYSASWYLMCRCECFLDLLWNSILRCCELGLSSPLLIVDIRIVAFVFAVSVIIDLYLLFLFCLPAIKYESDA